MVKIKNCEEFSNLGKQLTDGESIFEDLSSDGDYQIGN